MEVATWIIAQIENNLSCSLLLGLVDGILQLVGNTTGELYNLNVCDVALWDVVHDHVGDLDFCPCDLKLSGMCFALSLNSNRDAGTVLALNQLADAADILTVHTGTVDRYNNISVLKAGLLSW